MITFKIRGLAEAQKQLKRLEKALPYALADAANSAAFEAQREYRRRAEQGFVLRSEFTKRSIQVTKANPRGARVQAVVGSVASYMLTQESGGREPHKFIPGPSVGGGVPGGKRPKKIRPSAKISKLRASVGKGGHRGQRNAVAIALAKKSGSNVALIERRGRKGKALFRVGGGRRTLKMRLLYVVDRRSVPIKGKHMLEQTVRAISPSMPRLMREAVVRQCRRNRLFGFG